MKILCIGLSHKTAQVALREKLNFDGDQARSALKQLAGDYKEAEFLLLSTCNRVEVYVARKPHTRPGADHVRTWLADFHQLPVDELEEKLYTLDDSQAVEHLLAVAGGLDSLVPGEPQIVAQLKDAYALAIDAGTARAAIGELVQAALHVAKHIRSETGIGAGKVSVASVVTDFVQHVFKSLLGRCVLNIGAGKMNELMLRQLAKLGPEQILVANRSAEKAQHLAEACGGRPATFDRIQDHLALADVVLTSTASHTPIISREMVQAAQAARNYQPLLIVDIAVPRDVEAAAGDLDNVFLYNIDDLDQVVSKTLQMRQDQRQKAEKIIDDHLSSLTRSLHVRHVSPVINALYRRMEKIAGEELRHARNKLSTHEDAAEDEEIIKRALHRTIRRILHAPATNLRASAGLQQARNHIDAIKQLFELDDE